VGAARGDNRALAPALKDLGRAQAKAHKNAEAIATLKQALSVAGQEAAVRAEIYETVTEIYRADQQLGVLIQMIEAEHPSDFARLALLGALYEETGDAAKALSTYQRALAQNPRHIDLRLKMIRLLQSQGELDKASPSTRGSSARRRTTPRSSSSSATPSCSAAIARARSSSWVSSRRGRPATKRCCRASPIFTGESAKGRSRCACSRA